MTTRETCDECRFDSDAYTRSDVLGTVLGAPIRWGWLVEGVDPSALPRRPAPTTWSVVEYVAHSADVLQAHGQLLHHMTTTDVVLPDPRQRDAGPDDPPPTEFIDAAIERLAANASRYANTIRRTAAEALARTATIGDDTFDGRWLLGHTAHDINHHLSDGGRVLAALRHGVPTQTGVVEGLFASGGGVPKRPISEAVIGYRGVNGDRQGDRKHHGRVWQALCVWSSEVVEQLRADGHPIAPGHAGENLSVAGIDWSALRPGTRIGLGDDVLIELTSWSPPCAKNARWFSDRDVSRIDHDQHPGWSRAYASVLADGVVRRGDPVTVEPRTSR